MDTQAHATPHPDAAYAGDAPIPSAPAAASAAGIDMEKHLTILGVLHIVYNGFGLLAGAAIFLFLTGTGLLSGEPEALLVTTIIGFVVASFLLVVSLPGLIGGFFVLQRASWSRILLLVVGFLNLLNFPFGTLLGIYTIWVLMHDETVRLFE